MTLTTLNNISFANNMTNPCINTSVRNIPDVSVMENKLNKILEEDKKLDNPVFLFIKDDFISKLVYFLSGCAKRPVSIGIAGETASGKSTFTMDLIETIEKFELDYNYSSLITRVNTDDYYYDRSKEVIEAGSFANFAKNYDLDIPDAFELDLLKYHVEQLVMGKSVMLPKYDMSGTAIRYDNHIKANPNRIIISEGLFNLSNGINDVFDISIYVDVEREVQKERFYKRAAQRGLGDSAEQVYNNAVSKAEIYVMPSMNNADIIVSGMADRNDYKYIVNKLLDIFTSIQKEKVLFN